MRNDIDPHDLAHCLTPDRRVGVPLRSFGDITFPALFALSAGNIRHSVRYGIIPLTAAARDVGGRLDLDEAPVVVPGHQPCAVATTHI